MSTSPPGLPAGGPQAPPRAPSRVRATPRVSYRLFIGGAFPRAASGRTFDVHGADGAFLASAALAAGRDARDAVVAARGAFPAWSGAAGYDRGQALYRVAEVVEEHRALFAGQVRRATGCSSDAAYLEVDAAVDRWTWYAGWADKITQVRGAVNPVAGPFGTVSLPEPVGVTAVLAPQDSALLGLVSVLAPAIVSGNTAVLVASERYPLLAVGFAEALAAAALPAGVVRWLRSRPGWPPTRTSTRSTWPVPPARSPTTSPWPRRATSSAWSASPTPTGAPSRALSACSRRWKRRPSGTR